MRVRTALIGVFTLLAGLAMSASGPVGIYAIVDKVVFEPDEQAPARVQVWGSFAYIDQASAQVSPAKRGYMYFKVPPLPPGDETVRREWADLKSVAGTGQAVAFGRWLYIGQFKDIRPGETAPAGLYALTGGSPLDLRVRPATEPTANPADYHTNTGIVKLTEASHAAVIRALRDAP